jgi:membrane protein YqaA with SNARE-associated domain
VKLVTFFALALLVHGPLSPFLPTAFEATLLYYARLYPAWLLALVGTLGASIAESVNYRLVDWATELPKLARLADGRGVRWSVAAFRRAPFWTTVIVIFSPIPDTAVRVLAPLARYPLPRFLGAVALGRFPRLLLIAGVGGVVAVPTWALLGGGIALLGFAVARPLAASTFRWLRGRYRVLYAMSVAGLRL